MVGFDGRPVSVTEPDKPLICGISLAQVQQLMVKTCAGYLFLQEDGTKRKRRGKAAPRHQTVRIFKEKPQAPPQNVNKDPRALERSSPTSPSTGSFPCSPNMPS